jgi:hypothetical protein
MVTQQVHHQEDNCQGCVLQVLEEGTENCGLKVSLYSFSNDFHKFNLGCERSFFVVYGGVRHATVDHYDKFPY